MGQPLHVSQIIARVESMIKQLEALSYGRDAKMMLKLNGHIDEAITCGALNKSVYAQRIDKANLLIMSEEPEPVKIGMGSLGKMNLDPHIINASDGQAVADGAAKAAQEAAVVGDEAVANAPQIDAAGASNPVPNSGM